MLYVTTRNDRDTFTSHQVLVGDRAEDGGFYVPLRIPVFHRDDLEALRSLPFSQRIAEVLNVLFQTQLDRWDVEFCIGRNPLKLVSLRNQIVMGEFWHNPDWCWQKTENSLAKRLRGDTERPGSWLRIAIRIAVLAASCLDLTADVREPVDISMVSGDFLWPVSAWYGRKLGFPVGNIIMCCNENKCLWDLVCHGQLRTDTVTVSTDLPEADVAVPAELERLIYGCGGKEETEQYLNCLRRGVSYFAEGHMLSALQKGNYVSVVSTGRIRDIISGAMGTHSYLLSPCSALAYGGLLDYRAKKGALRPSLVICEKGPIGEISRICTLLGTNEGDIQKYL